MSFLFKRSTILAGVVIAGSVVAPHAVANERAYFQSVEGTWSGAGRIVAGPYKNTRFTCNLSGTSPKASAMKLAGKCRVGLFTQNIEATVSKRGGSYKGAFLDGAKGKGLDIVSGRLRNKRLVLGIKRKALKGTMIANLKSKNLLNITISVRVKGKLVPFIGLTMNRTGSAQRTTLVQSN